MADRVSPEYAAGFFDGEGSVSIINPTRADGRRWWRMVVVVSQNNRRPLDALQARWGGSVAGPRVNGQYEWRASSAIAERFLREVRPFLLVKGEAADIALEFRRGFVDCQRVGRRGIPIEEQERRMMLRERLVAHNGLRGRVMSHR